LLIAGAGVGAGALGLSTAGDHVLRSAASLAEPTVAPPAPAFRTRPDLRIPAPAVTTLRAGAGSGLIFLAPYDAPDNAQAGAIIVDEHGEVIWEQPLPDLITTDFRVQRYRGQPALTWWQGHVVLGHGVGHYVIADSRYKPLATVNAGNGRSGDLHEFLLTDRGTALLTTYLVVAHDLRPVGGSATGNIQDAMFQEIDIPSGRVLLEWHSLDHIALEESYWPLGTDWDYVHLNSIAVDSDQNLLVSSRNTHTIYKLDRKTGEIMWRLGGKRSDFSLSAPAVFAWQHDARRQPDGTISLFDNGDTVSRAIVLDVDEQRRAVTLRRAYAHPRNLFASSQGNVQVLPNGNVLVGWGAQPYVSEFSAAGELLLDAELAKGYISYRAYRIPWSGIGEGVPTVVTERAGGHIDAYVSWNGDTRVASWEVLGAKGRATPTPIGIVARTGFETGIRIQRAIDGLVIRGVDAGGATVGRSPLVAV
jgi:hypothetical protein